MLVRVAAALGVAVALLAGGAAAAAEDLPIAAFAGRFAGTGIAKDEISKYFEETIRDLDVSIVPEGGGFALSWSTVLRQGGDPDNPDVSENAHALFFEPTGRPNVFQGAVEIDPLGGWPFVWARIKENTLTVYSLLVHEDGSYEIQTYDRTLTGLGMELRFTRVRDGELVRSVTGKLVKVGGYRRRSQPASASSASLASVSSRPD